MLLKILLNKKKKKKKMIKNDKLLAINIGFYILNFVFIKSLLNDLGVESLISLITSIFLAAIFTLIFYKIKTFIKIAFLILSLSSVVIFHNLFVKSTIRTKNHGLYLENGIWKSSKDKTTIYVKINMNNHKMEVVIPKTKRKIQYDIVSNKNEYEFYNDDELDFFTWKVIKTSTDNLIVLEDNEFILKMEKTKIFPSIRK